MRGRPPAASEPSTRLPARVEATAHVVRPRAVVHMLAELVAVAPARLAEEPLECPTAVVAMRCLVRSSPACSTSQS
eukprot:3261938-Alexandrium_andersonii.AAC.1